MLTEKTSRLISFVLFAPMVVALLVGLSFYLFPSLAKQMRSFTGSCDFSSLTSAQDYRQAALQLGGQGERECAIEAWKKVVEKRPTDVSALGNLAMRLSNSERYQEALPYYEQAIKLGGGAADLFAWYARTLRQLNQIQPAIDWYYRVLSVNSKLSDITAELSELLALQNKPNEAINVLAAYEEVSGLSNYFSGRKLSLQTTLNNATESATEFRVSRLHDKHFYLSARLSDNTESAATRVFMVDTGASSLTFPESWLEEAEIPYKTLNKRVKAMLANGDVIHAKQVKIPYLKLGPFVLNDVKALVCEQCQPLVGQSVLEHFDLNTQQVNGVEFLYLKQRSK